MAVPGLAGTAGHRAKPHTSPSVLSLQQAGPCPQTPVSSSAKEGAEQSCSPSGHFCSTRRLFSSLSHPRPAAADLAPAQSTTALEPDLLPCLSWFSKSHQIPPSGIWPDPCPVPAGQRRSGCCSPSGFHQGCLHRCSPPSSVRSQGHQDIPPTPPSPHHGFLPRGRKSSHSSWPGRYRGEDVIRAEQALKPQDSSNY